MGYLEHTIQVSPTISVTMLIILITGFTTFVIKLGFFKTESRSSVHLGKNQARSQRGRSLKKRPQGPIDAQFVQTSHS